MNREKFRFLSILTVAGLTLGLAGCPGSSDSGGSGMLSVAITDTPVDSVQNVVVAFTGIDVHGPSGIVSFQFQQEKTVDLLTLQGGNDDVLISRSPLPAGDYQWIRLELDLGNSYVVADDGNQYPLTVPSGSETGLKLVSGFTVAQGGEADFAIDFDLRKSLKMTVNGNTGEINYILRPTLRLIDLQQVGAIAGSAAGDMTVGGQPISDPGCSPAVYVYPGTDAVPEGYYVTLPGGTPPLTSATLSLDDSTGNYDYKAGFLVPGAYTLAVTCAANDQDGATSLAFSSRKVANVSNDQTTSVDFP